MQQIALSADGHNTPSTPKPPRIWYSAEVIPFPKSTRADPLANLTRAVNAKVKADYAALRAAYAGRRIQVTDELHQRYDFSVVDDVIVGGLLDGSKADERPPRRRRKLKPYPTYYDLLCAARPIDADGKPLPLSKAAQAASYCDIRIAGKVYCSPYVRVDIWRATRSAHEREAFRADFARGRDHQITFAPKPKRCPRWYAFDGNKRQGFSWLQQSAVSNEATERSKNYKRSRRKRASFLEPEQKPELFKRIEAGDVAARNEVVAAFQPMVIRISKEFAKQFDCPVEDLVQVANCGTGALGSPPSDGLIYSLRKYRQSDGALPPYAERAIKWALLRYLERRQRSKMATLDKVSSDEHDGDTWKDSVPDSQDDVEAEFDVEHYRARLNEALDSLGLSARDRLIFESRHGLNGRDAQTLEAIGRDLGISGERVRQVERRIQTKVATVLTQAVRL
jgi:RNA polymerase sigma factor (sigma-70 family)